MTEAQKKLIHHMAIANDHDWTLKTAEFLRTDVSVAYLSQLQFSEVLAGLTAEDILEEGRRFLIDLHEKMERDFGAANDTLNGMLWNGEVPFNESAGEAEELSEEAYKERSEALAALEREKYKG